MLVNEIKTYFGERGIPHYIKYIDPSYTIRAVPANANDSIYCGFLGQHAVHAAMSRQDRHGGWRASWTDTCICL